jgi:SAM-dependent methyltransferase
VGVPEQRVLDLGTATGVLARAFARRGARVTAVDISEEQISAAGKIAVREGVEVDFRVGPAEEIDLPAGSFDVVSAGQSWLYFDAETMVEKVLHVLAPEGRLVLTHLLWLPGKDPIARASEELVLRHNSHWSAAGYEGLLPAMFDWAEDRFVARALPRVSGRGRRPVAGADRSVRRRPRPAAARDHRRQLRGPAPDDGAPAREKGAARIALLAKPGFLTF